MCRKFTGYRDWGGIIDIKRYYGLRQLLRVSVKKNKAETDYVLPLINQLMARNLF